jgi:hypothetical protein
MSKTGQVEKHPNCHLGSAKETAPSFIVWGDSHAAALAPAFNALAERSGITGWIASTPACLPLLDVERVGTRGCSRFNQNVLTMIQRDAIPEIVLVGRWAVALLGFTGRELDEGSNQVFIFDSASKTRSLQENERVFARGLSRLLSHPTLQGRKVVLVIDLPDTGVDTPRYLARSVTLGPNANAGQDVRIAMTQYSLASTRVDDLLARTAAQYHAVTIDPKTQLCDNSQCLIARNGQSLYRDSHHLTVFGALQLVDLFQAGIAPPDSSSPVAGRYNSGH